MSRPGDARSRTQKPLSAAGHESLSDRFTFALALDGDKPDSKHFATDLDSPVSPLPTRSAAITTTTSSSSSGSAAAAGGVRRAHSGELSGSSDGSPTSPADRKLPRPGHRRSGSSPLIYSGSSGGGSVSSPPIPNSCNICPSAKTSKMGSSPLIYSSASASSPIPNSLPAGNICPSGKIAKTGMIPRTTIRSDVLGSGTGNYGHGSIMWGMGKPNGEIPPSGDSSKAMESMNLEELTKVGNEHYKRGQFVEALRLYDRAIVLCPGNASCRSNRAAVLTVLGRLGEAVRECDDAIRLDPAYGRAHQRLASLLLRLGQVENARRHLNMAGEHREPAELQKLQIVERHFSRYEYARKIRDWRTVLREADAAVAAGVDSSPWLITSRAEALLRLHQLDRADSTLADARKLEPSPSSCSTTKLFDMLSDSYIHIVRAQVEMALGRFESAVLAAERAKQIDPRNTEVTVTLNNVRSVARARARGNELFKSGNFADACMAYAEGLKIDPSNSVLHCNRAACRSKLGQWEKSVEDCNEALRIQPNYTKALLRRAASNAKLERWFESVRDYEILRKELPGDTDVAEALFHAQVALRISRGEEVSNMKFGGEVEKITLREQFQAAISFPGVSLVYFMDASNQQCNRINPYVDSLCSRYPSLNFLMVDIKESRDIAKDENVVTVPTFKIYKNGARVKEMIGPSQQMLEYSVRHYCN